MESLKDCLFSTHNMNHDMTLHVHNISCHETNKDEKQQNNAVLTKDDWFYLVNTLENWRVYAPRAVVKKNPVLAWRVMNLCKDPAVRVKGAYFTACFRRGLMQEARQKQLDALKIKLGAA